MSNIQMKSLIYSKQSLRFIRLLIKLIKEQSKQYLKTIFLYINKENINNLSK